MTVLLHLKPWIWLNGLPRSPFNRDKGSESIIQLLAGLSWNFSTFLGGNNVFSVGETDISFLTTNLQKNIETTKFYKWILLTLWGRFLVNMKIEKFNVVISWQKWGNIILSFLKDAPKTEQRTVRSKTTTLLLFFYLIINHLRIYSQNEFSSLSWF